MAMLDPHILSFTSFSTGAMGIGCTRGGVGNDLVLRKDLIIVNAKDDIL